MIATKLNIFPAVLLISIGITLVGCKDKSLIWDGTVKGEYKLENNPFSDKPKSIVASGSGTVQLYTGMVDHLRLGKDTPIPDCTFVVRTVSATGDYEIRYTDVDGSKFHIGEVDDGKGCQGRIDPEGPMVPISITHTTISLKDDGTVFVSINYGPKPEEYSYSQTLAYERKSEAERAADSAAHSATLREFTLTGERSWF